MDFIKLRECGLVPVIKIDDAKNAAPLAKALFDGGVDLIEITFRTAAAKDAIMSIRESVPQMTVGAGTVISAWQLSEAKSAGAEFIVTPGLDAEVVRAAQKDNLTIIPGVLTPSEIISGMSLGLNVFKFFPAENYGGINTIKALCAPFGSVSFVPTGGVNEKNAADYWKFEKVIAVGGSWVAPDKLIAEQNFEEITRRTKDAVELMKSVRELQAFYKQ